jgi:4-hydroxybenzoate polyprenyltransferase
VKKFASVGRLHIVAIAALGCFTFGWIFTGRHLWAATGLCALDWFLVNLLNRVVDLKEDRANGIVGTDFVAAHRSAILIAGFAVLFGSLAILPVLLPLRLAYHALGFAYNWPLIRGRRRIKQLYFWKNTASAAGFMITVFGYPLLLAPRIVPAAAIACCAAFFFLFELSYEIIYDLRDAPGDALADVRTYPVVHGPRGAVRIIDALIWAAMVILAAGFAAHLVPWRAFVMIAAPIVQLVYYKRAFARGITSGDCIRLTWIGVGLLAAYHAWIAAGLPGVNA